MQPAGTYEFLQSCTSILACCSSLLVCCAAIHQCASVTDSGRGILQPSPLDEVARRNSQLQTSCWVLSFTLACFVTKAAAGLFGPFHMVKVATAVCTVSWILTEALAILSQQAMTDITVKQHG